MLVKGQGEETITNVIGWNYLVNLGHSNTAINIILPVKWTRPKMYGNNRYEHCYVSLCSGRVSLKERVAVELLRIKCVLHAFIDI